MDRYTEDELKDLLGSVGTNVLIDKSVKIYNGKNMHVGSNVRIDAYCVLSVGADLTIGSFVHLAPFVQIAGNGGSVYIDDFCGISSRVNLFTATDDYTQGWMTNPMVPNEFRNVKVGNIVLKKHCIIGCGSVIMPKVTLDQGVAVGALSFVNKSVPEYLVVGGNPLTKLATRNKEKLENLEKELYEKFRINS